MADLGVGFQEHVAWFDVEMDETAAVELGQLHDEGPRQLGHLQLFERQLLLSESH